jgi:hypothetical protein
MKDAEVGQFKVYNLQRQFIAFLENAGLREERVPAGRGEVVFYNLGKFSQAISDFESIHFHSSPVGSPHHHADVPHPLRQLRPRTERPRNALPRIPSRVGRYPVRSDWKVAYSPDAAQARRMVCSWHEACAVGLRIFPVLEVLRMLGAFCTAAHDPLRS